MFTSITRGLLPAALVIGSLGEARAVSYGYSVQQTSGYTFSGVGVTVGTLTPLSSSSNAQNATNPVGGQSMVGGLDALQSHTGPVRPAENTFTPQGLANPDYSRGDVLQTLPVFTSGTVAEAHLAGSGTASGTGAWALSATVTFAQTGTLTLGFDFTNQLVVNNTGLGTVAVDFGYILSIKDAAGATVFTSAPTTVNKSLSLSGPGVNVLPGSGSASIMSTPLAAGTYTATLSGDSHVFITVPTAQVPDAGSTVTLLGISLLALAGALRLRSARS